MDKREFSIFSMGLKTYFPKDNLLPTDNSMELWYRSLKDIPYRLAEVFLQKWVASEKWSPSIAEIRKGCAEIVTEETPDWAAGWSEVLKAVGRWGYMQEEQALESMTEITRMTVERLGWKNICMSENEVADRANFRNVYEQIAKKETERRQIPQVLEETIAKIKSGAVPQIGDGWGKTNENDMSRLQ